MSFLSDQELDALRIRRMILHVVGGKEDFELQPEMPEIEHEEFFLARIQDSAGDSVHQFNDASETKAKLESMAQGRVSFEAGAQALSRAFSNSHVGSSRDGAFFVFELDGGIDGSVLYGMIKYDYRQAIELYDNKGRNALRQIVQAFIKEKRAIQKACIVRVNSGVAEGNVSALDRMGDAPDLTDYFAKFLDVKRERSNEELNKNLNDVVRSSLQECKDLLPDGGVATAVATVKDILRGRENIDEEAVREAVFVAAGRPADEEARAKIEKVVNRNLKSKRLNGIVFKPNRTVLGRAARRRIQTREGAIIEFPGDLENHSVTRVIHADGGATITIQTPHRLVEDGVIPDRVGRTS